MSAFRRFFAFFLFASPEKGLRRSLGPVLGACVLLLAASSCLAPGGADPGSVFPPDFESTDPQNPGGVHPGAGGSAAGPGDRPYTTAALLFNGTGVSTSDWQATEQILRAEGLSYQLANSAQLDAMSLEELASFGVLVVPGGKGSTITASLGTAARLRIRQAVRERGLGYVGFCAGAWVAVGPEAESSDTAAYGLAVALGEVLPAYYPGGTSAVAAMTPVSFASGEIRQLVWWGGPSTPDWPGGVVARYETGEPAISQTLSGAGMVVIAGPHPEAPESWRDVAGPDADGQDDAVAVAMIRAALSRRPLPAF